MIGQKSTCGVEEYLATGTLCYQCSYKCQTCWSWDKCEKCQPGYNLLSTPDGRQICTKTCKTLWVKDANGNEYMQGFYFFEGKCKSCLKGCLNCDDSNSCYECGNYKTGITQSESDYCNNIAKNSCPRGNGFEVRTKRCMDCQFHTLKYFTTATAKPTDPLVCDPTNIYDALICPQGSVFVKGVCTYSVVDLKTYSIEQFQDIVQKGCMLTQSTYPFKCSKCSPFYSFTTGPVCVEKYNKGVGNCEYDSVTKNCKTCSRNEDISIVEQPYDPNDLFKNDIDDQNYECPIKMSLRQRYSYNINSATCEQLQGMMYPPYDAANPTQKQVCMTTCPSSLDGQKDYYTQWKSINTDNVTKLPIISVDCVLQCDEGFAIDEVNKQCYECLTVSNCSRCSSNRLDECIACSKGYYLTDAGTCVSSCANSVVIDNVLHCLSCSVENCIGCSSATQCSKCNNNATPISNCQDCEAGFSKHWKNSNECIICNTQYDLFYVDNGVCHERCGKGRRFSDELQCDDGNNINGDGCDSNCKVEYKWTCIGGSERSHDYCYKIEVDDVIKENTDPNFNFSIKFDVPKDGKPFVQIAFTQKPYLKQGVALKDIFTIRISSLAQDEFTYDIVPYQTNNRILSKKDALLKRKQYNDQNSLVKYGEKANNLINQRILNDQHGFYCYLSLNTTLRNQEVIVFVDQSMIKNKDGFMLQKNSDITEIQKYIFISENDLEKTQQTNTIAQSAQGAAMFSGLSIAMMNNFYSLMAVVDITEIIYYFLYLDIDYPENVSSFFEQFDNFQLPFLPNPFDSIIDDVVQNCHPHVYELDTDSLYIRNSGTNLFAVSIFAGLFIFVKTLQVLFKRFTKFAKVNTFLSKAVLKLQYEYALEIIYVVFLNFVASCFLQLQDTSVGDKTEKEHTAEVINMVIFSFSFAGCFIIPTVLFIFLWKNRKIIEFNPEVQVYHIQQNENEDSPQMKSQQMPTKFGTKQLTKDQFETKSVNQENIDEETHQIKLQNDLINNTITPRKDDNDRASKCGSILSKENAKNNNIINDKEEGNNNNRNSHNQLEEQSLKRSRQEKEHEEFMEKWGSLMMGCKTNDFKLYIYNVITYYRKIIMMAIIMCMMDYAELQLLLLVIHHILVAVYITKYMPFEKLTQNIINVLSEILFILLEVFVMRLTSASVNQADEDERRHIGNWIIAFFLSIIAIHLLLMIFELIHDLFVAIIKILKKRSNKINSTVHILKQDPLNYKNKKQSIFDNDFVSIPPTVNNSILITKNKYEKNQPKGIEAIKISQLNDAKSNLEPRNSHLMDSFALSLKTPQNQNNQKKGAVEKIKLTQKDTSPLSEDGGQAIIKKKPSSSDEEDDYQLSHNIINGSITPTNNIPLTGFNMRRRSTRTQDQTPFHLKSNRLSLVFKKESLPISSTLLEEIKSNLKIPSLEEVHETSNSPSSKNDTNSVRIGQITSNQSLQNQNSFQNTPGREYNEKLKSDSPEHNDSPKAKPRQRNVSRLSIFNNRQETHLILTNNQESS